MHASGFSYVTDHGILRQSLTREASMLAACERFFAMPQAQRDKGSI